MVENKVTNSPVVCLSSDSEADDDTARNNAFPRGKKRSSNCSFHCTACGTEMIVIAEVHEHPRLRGVGICSDCFDFLVNSPFTKDPVDGTDEQCRWCGEGGTMIMCGNCEKAFCEDCLVRNYGRKRGSAPILSNVNWSCFCCNPKLLGVHVNRLNEFRNSMCSRMNFSPRLKDARTSETRHASRNASDGNQGNQCQTTAELLTPNKEQNQGEGIQKRVATPRNKQHVLIGKPQQQAPAIALARTFIRPHQMIEKRREATERRKKMATERLKSGVTNVKENGTQQHDSNLEAKPEIQDGGGELSMHERESVDETKALKKQNCIVM